MQLPFTRDQFFDLFAAYNGALWPALVALWTASVVASVLLLSSRRPTDRWISALLAAHWAWSALAYHVAFFSRINPAAWMFARLNWTTRTSMRRYTRLSNGFGPKHEAAVALTYFAYNFIKIHRTPRVTPAMAAKVTDRLFDVSDILPFSKCRSPKAA
jgi:Family of unknown function (DUF6064)